jgi:hypothetical protein
MIIKKEKKGNVTVYYLDKEYDDNKMEKKLNTKIKREHISLIIKDDADVFNKEGHLLLRFRKNKLKKENTDAFYENVIHFAKNTSSNRGNTTGDKHGDVSTNKKIMSNILGYFDKLAPNQKLAYKTRGKHLPKITVRETRFNQDHPDNFKKLVPLIKEIDNYYEQYIPENYGKQRRKANQTPFRIPGTAFTTITTNVNFQTFIHTDKGDDNEGFGNLAVIERGEYKGGETCFPQYGVGVDVRTGDVLYMDVHQPHANLPLELESPDVIRLSIVCYLRTSIWKQTRGKSKAFMEQHTRAMRKLRHVKNTTRKNK